MILVYATNNEMDEVADLSFDGRVGYRNPHYWRGEVERCKAVYVHGDYPKLKEAYKDKLINPDPQKGSTDYTIAELREMKPNIDDWEAFTANDDRKSIDQL